MMTRYYVDYDKDYHGKSGEHDERGRALFATSTRKNLRICDRHQPGDQVILHIDDFRNIALADEICEFLNSR